MLDMTYEYIRIIMKRNRGITIPSIELPKGYSFVKYISGDEQAWGEIETSVLEFDNVKEAKTYFLENYVPYCSEVSRRTIFIENKEGNKVATLTAWWNYTGNRRHPFLHWIAVRPEYQGLGLGKAIIMEGIRLMIELEGECEIYVPTSTRSHTAIKLYKLAGFDFELNESKPGGFENQTKQALEVIGDHI